MRTFIGRGSALVLSLATSLAVAGSVAASSWPSNLPEQPSMVRIDGYLDRVPEKVPVLDSIEITGKGEPRRQFLVTEYGMPGEMALDRHLSRSMSNVYGLMGKPELVARVLEAPAGARVRGMFVAYTYGSPALLIGELEIPEAPAS